MEVTSAGGSLELDDLTVAVPLEGAGGGGGFGVAGGGAEDGCAVLAGEGEGEFVGGEVEEDFFGAERGPVVAHGGEVEGEGDLGETGAGVEAEGDHHGDGVEEARDEDGVIGVGLEVVVGGGADGEGLVIELGVDAVAGLAEAEVVPGELRGGCGGG